MEDQIRTLLQKPVPKDPVEFRVKVVTSFLANRLLSNFEDLPIDEWIAKYCINRVHVSHLALQLISNMYKIKINVYQLFLQDGMTEVLLYGPEVVLGYEGECNLLHLSELRFYNGKKNLVPYYSYRIIIPF